jgi:tRNA-(ms[2]io[6]A)-hydroxylase
MVGEALELGPLKDFYRELAVCEARHHVLFVDLARRYHAPDLVAARLDELLALEAEMLAELPLRAAVH